MGRNLTYLDLLTLVLRSYSNLTIFSFFQEDLTLLLVFSLKFDIPVLDLAFIQFPGVQSSTSCDLPYPDLTGIIIAILPLPQILVFSYILLPGGISIG